MPYSPHEDEEDFSFLPTVDSVGQEGLDKAALWRRYKKGGPNAPTPPPVPGSVAPPLPEEPPPEPHYIAEPEPVHTQEETWAEEQLVESHHLEVDPPLHLDHGHSHASEWAEETFRMLEEEQHAEPQRQPVPAPPLPSKRNTPPVSLGKKSGPVIKIARMAPAAESKFDEPAPAEPPPLPAEPPPLPEMEPTGEDIPEVPADNADELRGAWKRAAIIAAAAHLFVALILLLVKVVPMNIIRPEIVAVAGVEEQEVPAWQRVTSQPQTSAAPSMVAPIVASGTSSVAMPQVDFSPSASELNVGTSFGSFGAGATGGAGGTISFMGNKSSGKHIVFVVDVSGSMSASSQNQSGDYITRFELLKKELVKSISQLKSGISYQVLYFSDFAWPHDEIDSNDFSALTKYEWKIRPGQSGVRIPPWKYLVAGPDTVRRSRKIIEDSNNPGGTNWGSGLLMALNGNPRPDVIFFMTDGNKSDALTWVQEVTNANSRGKRAIINTTAMMEPDAADDLADLAARNRGKFTVVLGNGQVLQGDEFFKRRGQ